MKLDIKELHEKYDSLMGKEIELNGWIKSNRDQSSLGFIDLNDGTSFKGVQVVYTPELKDFDDICKLQVGSSVNVKGVLVKSEGANQEYEVKLSEITLLGGVDIDYPLQSKGRPTREFLREIAYLRPRTNLFNAVFRVRSIAAFAIHKYFQERGYVYFHAPLITASDCEGAGEMFKVTTIDFDNIPRTEEGAVDYKEDFFGKETNLTVSGQLNAETFALAFRNVYTFGPTFRAENSNTARHAAEFWMVEPEIAFADLEDDMELAEDMLKYVIKYVMDECPEEMAFFNQFVEKGLLDKLNHIVTSDFGKVTYTEAVELLKNCGKDFEYPVEWGMDLQTEHERYLTEEIFKKPVFVTDYPKDIKAFYMRLNDDGKTVAATDCLVPGIGEIIGGSQREERLDVLKARMAELGLKEEDYWWYLELRKYGETKHAGFGLGFERLIMYITGMSNIRDVIPFPRTTGQSDF